MRCATNDRAEEEEKQRGEKDSFPAPNLAQPTTPGKNAHAGNGVRCSDPDVCAPSAAARPGWDIL